MKPGDIRCPRCFAPVGMPCVTEQGIVRPAHAERIEQANTKTSEAVSAGFEESQEVRSSRFEENEFLDIPLDDREALAETAVEQLREVLESAELDEATGELVVSARTPEGVEIIERLHSFGELHAFVREFGFDPDLEEWGFGYGGPIRLQKREIDAVLAEIEAATWFSSMEPVPTKLFRVKPGILLPETKIEIAGVNEELIRYFAKHPDQLYALNPRKFEEVVEAIFRDFKFDVVLTPRSKDGGLDIRAIRKDSVGTLLYLIECKRYAPERPVGIDIVRALYGVAISERASCGLVVTTSHFTRGAKEFAEKNKYQLSLRDYNDLVKWLQGYPISKKSNPAMD
jgi:hypothetical protein